MTRLELAGEGVVLSCDNDIVRDAVASVDSRDPPKVLLLVVLLLIVAIIRASGISHRRLLWIGRHGC